MERPTMILLMVEINLKLRIMDEITLFPNKLSQKHT